jgi:outer membrane protein OmpA-like peptidoglycan-associated protein
MRLLPALLILTLATGAVAQTAPPAQRGAPAPPLALPTGMAPLTQGAYRLSFRTGETALPAGTAPTLAELGRRLGAASAPGTGRITVEGHASGPTNDVSAARRIALARATAVRDALVAGGLDATRVDVSALGRTALALDAADILPPGVTRSTRTR